LLKDPNEPKEVELDQFGNTVNDIIGERKVTDHNRPLGFGGMDEVTSSLFA